LPEVARDPARSGGRFLVGEALGCDRRLPQRPRERLGGRLDLDGDDPGDDDRVAPPTSRLLLSAEGADGRGR
jgi:hypothetical protein